MRDESRRPTKPRSMLRSLSCASVLLGLLLSTCQPSDPTATRVNVRLTGVTPNIDTLRVFVTLDGAPTPKSPLIFDFDALKQNLTEFYVDFPVTANHGLAVLGIEAQEKKCLFSSGQGQVVLSGQPSVELKMTIAEAIKKTCPFTVQVSGAGRVTSEPAVIDCGKSCVATFEKGQQVKLTALPEIAMSPYRWTNACSGSADCVITISGATQVGVDFSPRVCSAAGWCWESPRPQGNNLRSVWLAADQSIYAVGDSGTIIYSANGTIWVSLKSGTSANLRSVWGTASNDVWAVGDGGLALHWNGAAWSTTNTATTADLQGVWGSAKTDVWAVGNGGTILHWDGAAWSRVVYVGTERLRAVWGANAADVWIVGDGGTALRKNGTAWSKVDAKTAATANLQAIWGSGPADVWAVGNKGIIRRWNGTDWLSVRSDGTNDFSGVSGSGANTAWITNGDGSLWRWDGFNWMKESGTPNSAGLFAVVSASPNNFWAVGAGGAMLRWNGTDWTKLNTGIEPSAVFGGHVNAGWASGPDDAWLVGVQGEIFHWNGLVWSAVLPKVTSSTLWSVWGSGPDDVWAAGDAGTIVRYNGREWTVVSSGTSTNLAGIHGRGPNDVWAVGDSGTTLHWTGASWIAAPSAPSRLRKVLAATQVTAVGDNGVYRFDGTGWSSISSIGGESISGSDAEMFSASSIAGVQRWDGTKWTMLTNPATQLINAVYVAQPGDAWLVGQFGAVLHWDGNALSQIDAGTGNWLTVTFGAMGSVWAVGENGSVLRYRK